MHKLGVLVFALLLPAVLSRPALAQISDGELTERIVDAITTYANYTIFDSVEVTVDRGNVTLTGRVMAPTRKSDIEARVKRIDGIRSLKNDIGVLPRSQTDDAIRQRVAQAILNSSAFWDYAQMPQPPIHIIVESGRVTLTGAVDTEIRRVQAQSLAEIRGSFAVTNRIRVDPRR